MVVTIQTKENEMILQTFGKCESDHTNFHCMKDKPTNLFNGLCADCYAIQNPPKVGDVWYQDNGRYGIKRLMLTEINAFGETVYAWFTESMERFMCNSNHMPRFCLSKLLDMYPTSRPESEKELPPFCVKGNKVMKRDEGSWIQVAEFVSQKDAEGYVRDKLNNNLTGQAEQDCSVEGVVE